MCNFGSIPKVQRRDVAAEQREAERKATEKSNADLAGRRARRRSQSLIANRGGAGGLGFNSAITNPGSRNTLG